MIDLNRKRRLFDNIWNFNFDEVFNSFEAEINSHMKASSDFQEGEPLTYGYSVRIGSDTGYQPEIRQWGNLNDFRRKQGLPELQIPLKGISKRILPVTSLSEDQFVDFIDEDEYLKIIVEVPGFTKDNLAINIDETGSEITLVGTAKNRELNKTIKLPSKIEAKTTKSTIKNGVLEIRSKKKSENTSNKFQVKID